VSYEIGSVQLGPQQFQMQQKIYLSLLRQCWKQHACKFRSN
jgi:hypothetical protein